MGRRGSGCGHTPQKPDGGDRADRTLPLGRGGVYRDTCAKCGAVRVDAQIGLEPTPEEYVNKLVAVFREVRRVLKDDGTLWVNLGDSYATDQKGGEKSRPGDKSYTNKGSVGIPRTKVNHGVKSKDLIGIPWMVAFALRSDGWWLRQDIIWNKPNPMPESVTDRCTKAHEYIFLLSKSARYYFDMDAIREDYAPAPLPRAMRGLSEDWTKGVPGSTAYTMSKARKNVKLRDDKDTAFGGDGHSGYYSEDGRLLINPNGRNKRDVWTVTTKPYREAHFATFPPDLIEPCILAGSKEGDTVLDPFSGSGTTLAVAIKHHRDGIGIDLNPKYITLTERRLRRVQPVPFRKGY